MLSIKVLYKTTRNIVKNTYINRIVELEDLGRSDPVNGKSGNRGREKYLLEKQLKSPYSDPL